MPTDSESLLTELAACIAAAPASRRAALARAVERYAREHPEQYRWLRGPSPAPLFVSVLMRTMGVYAKSAFPAMAQSPSSLVFDFAITMGYAILLGMLSRESLEKLLNTARSMTLHGQEKD